MDQKKLAEISGLSTPTIKRLEAFDGPLVAVKVATLDALRAAFDDAGVQFTFSGDVSEGPGVSLKEN